jgi:hypothetical protein
MSLRKLRVFEAMLRREGLSIRAAATAVALLKVWLRWADQPGSPPLMCACCTEPATHRDRYGWTCHRHADPLRYES